MKSLQVEAQLLKLSSHYPDAAAFREAVEYSAFRSRESVVRLWLTEGIPFAFRDRPAVYEALRAWLGDYLRVCPKDITLVGSARIGFSLASSPDFGRPFNINSDLDLSVVSRSLFDEFAKSFQRWKADYRGGVIQPRHEIERQLWEENMRLLPNTLSSGFVDANKIPTRKGYPIAQSVGNAMWLLKEKLKITDGAPKVQKSSVRVYNSWRSLVERVSFNLSTALSQRSR
jgi:hypothetical protein